MALQFHKCTRWKVIDQPRMFVSLCRVNIMALRCKQQKPMTFNVMLAFMWNVIRIHFEQIRKYGLIVCSHRYYRHLISLIHYSGNVNLFQSVHSLFVSSHLFCFFWELHTKLHAFALQYVSLSDQMREASRKTKTDPPFSFLCSVLFPTKTIWLSRKSAKSIKNDKLSLN